MARRLRSAAWALVLLALSVAWPTRADAQGAANYPDHPVKLVVPYTPGGQFDIHARMLAENMGGILGKPVVIENKPGAGTMLAAEYVAGGKNDGYTILFVGANMLAIAPHLYKSIRYKVSDFQTISLISSLPMGIVINTAKIPAKTLPEFIAYVKANPGKVTFGTSGTGGAQHLMGELAKMRMGLNMVQVGYRGTPEVLTDLLAGDVSVSFDGIVAYLPHAGEGKALRILAISSGERLAAAPDIPTYAELGYPDMTLSTFGGIVAPAGTPMPIIDKLHDAIVKANSDPAIRQRVVESAAIPKTSTPQEFDALIKSDSAIWGEVVRKLNLRLD
jgi:tripartite-type tricarboxylate transporter receptor subunit TctC